MSCFKKGFAKELDPVAEIFSRPPRKQVAGDKATMGKERFEISALPSRKGSQTNWKYQVISHDGENKLLVNLSDRTYQWSIPKEFPKLMDKPNLGGAQMTARRLTDIDSHYAKEMVEGAKVFSEGRLQVHSSGPSQLHATIQDGKVNPTFELSHDKNNSWKFVPKARPAKADPVKTLTDKAMGMKQAFLGFGGKDEKSIVPFRSSVSPDLGSQDELAVWLGEVRANVAENGGKVLGATPYFSHSMDPGVVAEIGGRRVVYSPDYKEDHQVQDYNNLGLDDDFIEDVDATVLGYPGEIDSEDHPMFRGGSKRAEDEEDEEEEANLRQVLPSVGLAGGGLLSMGIARGMASQEQVDMVKDVIKDYNPEAFTANPGIGDDVPGRGIPANHTGMTYYEKMMSPPAQLTPFGIPTSKLVVESRSSPTMMKLLGRPAEEMLKTDAQKHGPGGSAHYRSFAGGQIPAYVHELTKKTQNTIVPAELSGSEGMDYASWMGGKFQKFLNGETGQHLHPLEVTTDRFSNKEQNRIMEAFNKSLTPKEQAYRLIAEDPSKMYADQVSGYMPAAEKFVSVRDGLKNVGITLGGAGIGGVAGHYLDKAVGDDNHDDMGSRAARWGGAAAGAAAGFLGGTDPGRKMVSQIISSIRGGNAKMAGIGKALDVAYNAGTVATTGGNIVAPTSKAMDAVRTGSDIIERGWQANALNTAVNAGRTAATAATLGGGSALAAGGTATASALATGIAAPTALWAYTAQAGRMIGDSKYRGERFQAQVDAANQGSLQSVGRALKNPAASVWTAGKLMGDMFNSQSDARASEVAYQAAKKKFDLRQTTKAGPQQLLAGPKHPPLPSVPKMDKLGPQPMRSSPMSKPQIVGQNPPAPSLLNKNAKMAGIDQVLSAKEMQEGWVMKHKMERMASGIPILGAAASYMGDSFTEAAANSVLGGKEGLTPEQVAQAHTTLGDVLSRDIAPVRPMDHVMRPIYTPTGYNPLVGAGIAASVGALAGGGYHFMKERAADADEKLTGVKQERGSALKRTALGAGLAGGVSLISNYLLHKAPGDGTPRPALGTNPFPGDSPTIPDGAFPKVGDYNERLALRGAIYGGLAASMVASLVEGIRMQKAMMKTPKVKSPRAAEKLLAESGIIDGVPVVYADAGEGGNAYYMGPRTTRMNMRTSPLLENMLRESHKRRTGAYPTHAKEIAPKGMIAASPEFMREGIILHEGGHASIRNEKPFNPSRVNQRWLRPLFNMAGNLSPLASALGGTLAGTVVNGALADSNPGMRGIASGLAGAGTGLTIGALLGGPELVNEFQATGRAVKGLESLGRGPEQMRDEKAALRSARNTYLISNLMAPMVTGGIAGALMPAMMKSGSKKEAFNIVDAVTMGSDDMDVVGKSYIKQMIMVEPGLSYDDRIRLMGQVDSAAQQSSSGFNATGVLGPAAGALTGYLIAKSNGSGPVTTGIMAGVGGLVGHTLFKDRGPKPAQPGFRMY